MWLSFILQVGTQAKRVTNVKELTARREKAILYTT